MLDLLKVNMLYKEAEALAMQTPAMGSTLAGNCATVHYGMLSRARKIFGQEVAFTIGWISLNGRTYFKFTNSEYQAWLNGKTKPTYNLHAWLSLPYHGNEIIDLTLAATINYSSPGVLPGTVSFLTSVEAARHGIQYTAFDTGDDLLHRLHLLRDLNV
jgi:hypothetical protein